MVPKMRYKVKKMVFESFDTMIEVAFRIEDVLRAGYFDKKWKQQQQWSK